MRFAIALFLTGAAALWSEDWHEWFSKGMEAFKAARYEEAARAYQAAIRLAPREVTPHIQLGTVWMSEYIPGANSPENVELARKAEAEFQEVLKIEPDNETAILSIASLRYQEALGEQDPAQKQQKLNDAASFYARVVGIDPRNKEAYYSRGVIGWATWYSAWFAAREKLGMRPEDPGPLIDPAVRKKLKERYSPLLEQAVSDLEKALELEPMYDDAMAYMNLLVRERADLDDTPEQYKSDIQEADRWVDKAVASKRKKAASQK